MLLSLVMLVSVTACAKEKYDLLYATDELTETAGTATRTFCVRGSDMRARQIVVKEGDKIIWNEKVKVDSDVGSRGGNYGFEVLDLNFDGYNDFMIADNVAGDCTSYICWLWDTNEGTYVKSEALTGLCNIKTDSELGAIFSFSHNYEKEGAYLDVPETNITTDSATKYIWKDGALTPDIRASIIYYSETNMYLYSVAYYNEETQAWDEDYAAERWLTPEQYKTYDMGFLYYFK